MGSGHDDDDPGEIGPVSRPRASAPVDGVSGVDGPGAVDRVAAVPPGAIDAIAAALAAGEITPADAREQLIDHAVAAALPPDADENVRRALRATVTRTLEDDPVLQRLLSPA